MVIGVASVQCYSGGTVCFVSCTSGFTDANNGAPIICSPYGIWIGQLPPCAGYPPSAPSAPIAAVTGANEVTVGWQNGTTNVYPITSYSVSAVSNRSYFYGNFTPGTTPAEASNWVSRGVSASSFDASGSLAIETFSGQDCWHSNMSCAHIYQSSWPANVPTDEWYIEG